MLLFTRDLPNNWLDFMVVFERHVRQLTEKKRAGEMLEWVGLSRKLEGVLDDSPEGWCSGLAWRKLW
jgi:hypothetical protein